MQGGFSFCGVDIAKFGLEYVPTLDQTYVFASSGYDIHQETFDSYNGGYFYGTTVRPKDFFLRCIYQNQHIAHGLLDTVESFFKRGRTGRLVFRTREWVWYTATVINVDFSDLRNYENGFITIQLRAFYPFSRHDEIGLTDSNMYDNHIATNSGLLPLSVTPPTDIGPLQHTIDTYLYNGGSERASVAIRIAGDAGDGITITNNTTNQSAKFIAFSKADTTEANKYIVSDSLNGKTIITDGTNSKMAFMYHDYGFIELAPSFPIERDVYVSVSKGSDTITLTGKDVDDDVIGKFVRIGTQWHKIIDKHNSHTLVLNHVFDYTGYERSDIAVVNEISIELSPTSDITKLEFVYKPTFK